MSGFLQELTFADYTRSIAKADFADWITVAAYVLAGVMALRAARVAEKRRNRRERGFWLLIGWLMLFFGVNELFDFQTALTAIGKAWAKAGGWYEQRRLYQLEFIVALAAFALAAGVLFIWFTRSAHRAVQIALLGMVFIGLFVLVRATSFHHVEALMGRGLKAFNWGSVQEMIGILIVAYGARRYVTVKPRARR